jgi:hypothetical protein
MKRKAELGEKCARKDNLVTSLKTYLVGGQTKRPAPTALLILVGFASAVGA